MEIEIKLRVADRKQVLRLLRKLKASGGARMHEMNTLYDTPAGTLAREGKMVRIRVLTRASSRAADRAGRRSGKQEAVLTYKGPVQDGDGDGAQGLRYKVRQEHELRLGDAGALAQVLGGMGLRPCFRYEKYRTTYRLRAVPGLLVELDEMPIGDFLELEGDSAAIDRGAAMLGYGPADYITKSYGLLFLDQRRAAKDGRSSTGGRELPDAGADMMFRPGQ